MEKRSFFLSLVMVGLLAVCLAPTGFADGLLAEASLADAEGKLVGKVVFSEGGEGVRLTVNVQGFSPGYHGFHIHGTGMCKAPDFKSAGGHFNPFGSAHGLKNPAGPHAGDLANLLVGPDGIGTSTALAPLLTLGKGSNSLLKEGGTAVVIHSGPDDYQSQPSGAAGSRVACGVVKALFPANQ